MLVIAFSHHVSVVMCFVHIIIIIIVCFSTSVIPYVPYCVYLVSAADS